MRASKTWIRPGEVMGMTFMTKKLVLQQIDRSFLQRTGSCSPVVPTRYLSNHSKGAKGMSFFLSAPRPPRVLLMDPAKFRPPQNLSRDSFGEKKSGGLPAREKKSVRFGAIFFLKKRTDLARNFFW